MTRRIENPPSDGHQPAVFSCLLLTKSLQPQRGKFSQLLNRTKSYVEQFSLALNQSIQPENPLANVLEIIRETTSKPGTKPGSVLILDFLPLTMNQVPAMADVLRGAISAGMVVHNLASGEIYRSDTLAGRQPDLLATLTIMAAQFEESQRRSRRAGSAWHKRRQLETREPLTKRLPGWLRWDSEAGKITAIPERTAAIKQIYQLAREGASKREIALTMEHGKIPCWGATKRWTPSYINKLLTTPAVVGDYIPQTSAGGQRMPTGEIRSDYYPTVIARELWDYVQNLRLAKPHGRPSKRRVNNLFSGILWHGETGKKMSVVEKGKAEWTYLVGDPPSGKGTQRTHLNYLKFERNFLEFVHELDWVSLANTRPATTRDPQPQAAVRQRKQLEDRLRGLLETAEKETQPPNELVRRIREVRAQLQTVTAEISAKEGQGRACEMARSELAGNIQQFKQLIAAGEETGRAVLREHIRQMVERIEVFPEGLDELSHLENTRGYPVFRIRFRSGAVKSILTNDTGELVAVLDEPAT